MDDDDNSDDDDAAMPGPINDASRRTFHGAFASTDATFSIQPAFPRHIQEQMYTGYKKFHAYTPGHQFPVLQGDLRPCHRAGARGRRHGAGGRPGP